MFQKIKTQFTRAWRWSLAHLSFGRKSAKNPVAGLMDEAEQRYQAFQQKRRLRRFKRQATQRWSRFQQHISDISAPLRVWLKVHRRTLALLAGGIGIVLLGLAGLVLWRRSPAFRAALLTALGTAAAIIAAARTAQPVITPTPNPAVETIEPALEMA